MQTKPTRRSYKRLTPAQIAEYRALKHSLEIAEETRNKSRITELRLVIADLRHNNLAYREIN